jgi:hypothetical protein
MSKSSFKGFSAWYKRIVKKEYHFFNYRQLKELYSSELLNTGNIEIPARMTKNGYPAIW